MNRALQAMLADTHLVKNLSDPDYMELLLDGRPDLETLFAELDMVVDLKDLAPADENDRILPGFKSLTKERDPPARIFQMVKALDRI